MNDSGPRAIIVMGVAASGKTTVGTALASRLGWQFQDADAFHSEANRHKMREGRPLTDADRQPWLARLHAVLAEAVAAEKPVVLACSALTEQYRRTLIGSLHGVRLIYLRIAPELAQQRIASRTHFFPARLLASQFETLEEPVDAVVIDASRPSDDAVEEIVARLAAAR